MNKVKNFFLKIGKGLAKAWKVTVRFFKENVWAEVLGVLLAIVLFILVVQGIVKGIDSCKNEKTSNVANHATAITSTEALEKINNGDEFILFIGAESCSHCHEFYATVNKYIATTGKTIYYVDMDDTSDTSRTANLEEIKQKVLDEIPEDRKITSLSTPLTIYVKDGEFKDAMQGAYGMKGGEDYLVFCDIVEGNYVDKPVYTLSGSN